MPFNLNWTSAGTNGTYALADGTDSIGVTISTTTNVNGKTAQAASLGTPAASALWVSGLREPVTSTLDFSAPVSNFSFEIYDIDSRANSWDDQLTVLVTDAQGNVQAVNFGDLLADPYHSSSGNVLNADGNASTGVETSGAADSVSITIPGPVSRIQFIFDNGESFATSGMFGVGNMSFGRAALDYIVEGTDGADLIDDAYVLDPEGDRVNASDAANGSNDDVIQAGAGNDTVISGAGNDSIDAGTGNDSVLAGAGNDTVFGGSGNDTIEGGDGNDSLSGGDGQDVIRGGTGNDAISGGEGDDRIVLANGFGNDTIAGGETGETNGDTLDMSAITTGVTVDLTSANPESGSVSDGTSTASFTEIENIVLSSGADTLVLADGSGSDRVLGFQAPIDNGDGTFTTADVLNVAGLHDADGNVVNVYDVVVTDTAGDGTGNAILTFPNGESLTLVGVGVSQVSSPAQLNALGLALPDGIVYGTAGDDTIDAGYLGDNDGDVVDGNDALLPGAAPNDDLIYAGTGNDSVDAGLGDDSVVGEAGNDTLNGNDGNDTLVGDFEIDDDFSVRGNPIAGPGGNDALYGGAGNDSLYGGSGDDSLYGGDGDDSLLGGHGNDLLYGGAGDDDIEGLYGDDTIYGGDGNDHVFGRDGADLIFGGDGADTLIGSIGIDTIYGGAGNDIIAGSQGSDLIYGGAGDDLVYIGVPAPGDIAYDSEGSIYLDEGNDFLDAGDATLRFDAYGGEGNDYMIAGLGDDSLFGGTGNDQIFAGAGDDQLTGDEGNDYIEGQSGDDTFYLADGFGLDTLVGGETGETNGDLLDASALTTDTVLDLSAGSATSPEDGTLTATGSDSATFSEIERFVLGTGDDSVLGSSGNDRVATGAGSDTVNGGAGDDQFDLGAADGAVDYVVLSDNDGADTISSFEAPIDNGDGTYTGRDQLDVTNLTSDGGTTPVNTADVVVTDTNGDGTGDAVLTFPGGESVTLVGVLASQVDTPAELQAIGIPAVPVVAGPVDGTAGADLMPVGFVDAQGDVIDGADGLNDTIFGDAGDDTIMAGLGDDTVYGGADNDLIDGGAGADQLFGGAGNDTLTGGDGADTLSGGDDRDLFFGGIGDVIDGGEGGDDFDRLNLTNLGGAAMTNVIYGGGNNESGTVQVLDGTGAVIGSFAFSNIESVVPCFTPGSLILTSKGEIPVELVQVGDRVLTRDSGYQTIRWVGQRTLSSHELAAKPNFNPVCIQAGALGDGLPARDMTVSPQHRMLVAGPRAEMLFGEAEVLVAAAHMVNDITIRQVRSQAVTYIHLLFDQHEIIRSDGAWTESFQPGDLTLQGMDAPQRDEVLALFPTLQYGDVYPAARLTLRSFEAKVLLGR